MSKGRKSKSPHGIGSSARRHSVEKNKYVSHTALGMGPSGVANLRIDVGKVKQDVTGANSYRSVGTRRSSKLLGDTSRLLANEKSMRILQAYGSSLNRLALDYNREETPDPFELS